MSSRISRAPPARADPAGESAVSRAEPTWQAAIQEILGEAVTLDELKVLSLALGALRFDLGPAGLPESELAAGQRVLPPRTSHESIGEGIKPQVWRAGLEPATGRL
jgi:hypothetical protein